MRWLMASAGFGAAAAGVANLGLDLVAVQLLHASAVQIGLLNALGTVSYLALSVPAGVFLDRYSKRTAMVAADVVGAAGLLGVPIAYYADALSMWVLAAVSLVTGVAGMTFDIARRGVIPSLFASDAVTLAYSRSTAVSTSVEIAAPVVAGQLVRLVGAPALLFVGVVARLASAASVYGLREKGAEASTRRDEPFWGAMGEGLRFTVRSRPLLTVVASTALMNFGLALGSAVQMVFYMRTLGFGSGDVGLVMTFIGLGGLLGSLVAPWFLGRVSAAGALRMVSLFLGLAVAAMPLCAVLSPVPALIVACAQGAAYSVVAVIFNVNSFTMVASLTPTRLLGRQNGVMSFVSMGVVPVGSLVGGLLGEHIGYTATLWVWVAVSSLVSVPALVGGRRLDAAIDVAEGSKSQDEVVEPADVR